jgi:ribosomal protein L11 methyltransferase
VPETSAAKYVAVSFDVAAGEVEPWSDALLAAGALSVDAADASAGTAAEVPVYGEPDAAPWPVVRLTTLISESTPCEQVLAVAANSLGRAMPIHSTTLIAGGDWVQKSQAQFAPLRITERLWIVPSWRTPPDPKAIIVRLDPGLAFGTGAHPSTLLCLRWLALNLEPGCSLLDYGCGSGILAIAAAKLGANRVLGIDIDDQAVATSRANAQANTVVVEFALPDCASDERFDIVVANILANPLELLAPLLAAHVRPGGRLVLSGILDSQAAAVLAAYERWFNIGLWGSADRWVALAGVRCAR